MAVSGVWLCLAGLLAASLVESQLTFSSGWNKRAASQVRFLSHCFQCSHRAMVTCF